jgi:hypothetical protein
MDQVGDENVLQMHQNGHGIEAAAGQRGTENLLQVSQVGDGHSSAVRQDSSSSAVFLIQRGDGASATISQVGNSQSTRLIQFGTATANIVQGQTDRSSWNLADVEQRAAASSVNVTQRGSATSGQQNLVRIQQFAGGSNNSATATQEIGVGPSSALNTAETGTPGDQYYFSGGSRSAEIEIFQSGRNNIALAIQEGRGQYARIDQSSGSNNVARIFQGLLATNATAVIRQFGSGNVFEISQDAPNQYRMVTQIGGGNVVSDVIRP